MFLISWKLAKNRNISSRDLQGQGTKKQCEIQDNKYMGWLLDGEQWIIIKYAFMKSVKKNVIHQCCTVVFFFFTKTKTKTDAGLLNRALGSGVYSFIHFFHVGLLVVY